MKKDDQAEKIDTYSMLMQSPAATCVFMGKDYVLAFANDLYLEILGKDKTSIGQPLFASLPELKGVNTNLLIDQVLESGLLCTVNEHEVSMFRNGLLVSCFFNCTYQPSKDPKGTVTGVMVTFIEVTNQILLRNIQIENQKQLKSDLSLATLELAFQEDEKRKRAAELGIANIELAFQDKEKGKRAFELDIANIELAFQDEEKEKRAVELGIANIELAFQQEEKRRREVPIKN